MRTRTATKQVVKPPTPRQRKAMEVAAKQEELRIAEESRMKAIQAFEMRRNGKTWYEIASVLRITEREAAKSVSQMIQDAAELVDEGARHYAVQMSMARIEAVVEAMMPKAARGDVQAANTILRAVQTGHEILGLKGPDTVNLTQQTVVVAGDDYLNGLKEFVKRSENLVVID